MMVCPRCCALMMVLSWALLLGLPGWLQMVLRGAGLLPCYSYCRGLRSAAATTLQGCAAWEGGGGGGGKSGEGWDGRGKWAVVGSVSSAIDTRQSRTLPLRYTIVVQHGNRNWLIIMVIVIWSLINLIIMVIVEQGNGGTRFPRNKMAGSIV